MTFVFHMRLIILLSFALACSACLDRSDTESPGYSSFITNANTEVRPLERNADAKMKLDLNDGLPGPMATVPLRTGFVGGRDVQYWDLGTAPTSAEPMWVFVKHLGAGSEPTEHPPLIDSIPGDTAYSPTRIIFEVFVTAKWANQKFTSIRAIDDGVELGLLEEPVQKELFTNCVVTLKDVVLDAGAGQEPITPTTAYYRGKLVYQHCVRELSGDSGQYMTKMGAPVFGNAYLLRRENQVATLDESVFKADLNGDGDNLDSNVVFDANVGDAGYTSLWKNMEVVVSDDYMFGAVKGTDGLFEKMPWGQQAKAPPVVEYKDTTLIVNRPLFTGVP